SASVTDEIKGGAGSGGEHAAAATAAAAGIRNYRTAEGKRTRTRGSLRVHCDCSVSHERAPQSRGGRPAEGSSQQDGGAHGRLQRIRSGGRECTETAATGTAEGGRAAAATSKGEAGV